MSTAVLNYQSPDTYGYYGEFGGAYIPEMLQQNVAELKEQYLKIMADPSFIQEFDDLLADYVGRPTPLFKAERLSKEFNTNIYLKREDLCHTGAHKINNTIGQIYWHNVWEKQELLQKQVQDNMVLQLLPFVR